MSDIQTVPLKELQDHIKEYKGQKVRIAEFMFFATSNAIYEDYYLVIGPRGGVTVHYATNGKTLNLGLAALKRGSVEEGIVHKVKSRYYTSNVLVFPPMSKVPGLMAKQEQLLRANLEQYEKTYLNAKERLDNFIKLNEKFPEYSL